MLKENEAILKIRSDAVKKEKGTIESCERVVVERNVIAIKSSFLG